MKGKVFEYAIIRIVPCVVKQEFINAGVIVYSRHLRYIGIKYHINDDKLRMLQPDIDLCLIHQYMKSIEAICNASERSESEIARQEPPERFRWLTAQRSTIIQCSPIHTGIAIDGNIILEQLFTKFII